MNGAMAVDPRHLSGGSTSTRLADPPSQPALNDILERITRIRENAASLAARLTQTANRALGDVPQGVNAANGGTKAPVMGATGAIAEQLNDLESLIHFAHDQANRLERVA